MHWSHNTMPNSSEGIVVYSTANDQEEYLIKELCGEYVPKGINHGKPFYEKTIQDAETCFLYYWDCRDGAANEGWWFGIELGGNEVFSHNDNGSTPFPPAKGWKIPFDGADAVRDTLVVKRQTECTIITVSFVLENESFLLGSRRR